MKKFGIIINQATGKWSPQQQQKALIADGVPESNIVRGDLFPKPREGVTDTVVIASLEALAADPEGRRRPSEHFLAARYATLAGEQRILRIAGSSTEYKGVDGLANAVLDFTTSRRRTQTANGRKASGGRPRQDHPAFYDGLTNDQKRALKSAFETRTLYDRRASVAEIAADIGVSKASLERLAKAKQWARPSDL